MDRRKLSSLTSASVDTLWVDSIAFGGAPVNAMSSWLGMEKPSGCFVTSAAKRAGNANDETKII